MIILQNAAQAAELSQNVFSRGTVLTWGNFDGVHLGHQALIRATAAKASELGLPSVIMTFEPRPAQFFAPDKAPKSIVDLEDKLALLAGLGIDYTLVLPFDAATAGLEAGEFLRLLPLQTLRAKAMVLGYDLAFGRHRQGDFEFLRGHAAEYGYTLEQIPPLLADGQAISSTRIRRELAAGRLDELPRLLGRRHSVHGPVRHGFQRGRNLVGFATANLDPGGLLLPPNGVYACLARQTSQAGPPQRSFQGGQELPASQARQNGRGGQYWTAACNLGLNPSFGGNQTSLEAHLLDFSGDIYGADLRLYFIEYLRAEKTFAGPEELGRQIGLDVERTRAATAKELADPLFSQIYPL
ncbi:MAG: bifunctional riboflavin kinase/FMN adenylyltransferase [Deltaproteobacteria bacterium]|nr:bifunctional riboflavin kinase/FMN adenylyltransferase [Deltaproteobacteria bacterium]